MVIFESVWAVFMLALAIAIIWFSIAMAIDAGRKTKNTFKAFILVMLILFTAPLGAGVWYLVRRK